ncbi:MAG: hypothetical protein LUQ37_09995 [Methanoregulaceae archaeon]|jgi:hypothetical protein|nr:hypothetical protein [Methanoregulaceae archaeon]
MNRKDLLEHLEALHIRDILREQESLKSNLPILEHLRDRLQSKNRTEDEHGQLIDLTGQIIWIEERLEEIDTEVKKYFLNAPES